MDLRVVDRLPLRVAVVVRLVTLLALGVPVLWTRSTAGIIVLAAVGAGWLLVTILQITWHRSPMVPIVLDGLLIGAICGISLDHTPIALGTLAVPPFTAALFRGAGGVMRALAAECATLVLFGTVTGQHVTGETVYSGFSWLVLGLGLGLVGTFIYNSDDERRSALAPYHYAQGLLRQLIDISDGLDRGLNAVTLAGQLLWVVRERMPCSAIALYVPRGDGLTPLVAKSPDGDLQQLEDLAARCLLQGHQVRDFPAFALPLEAGSGVTAIMVAQLTEGDAVRSLMTEPRLEELAELLRPAIVQLDTALLFASFRERASTEERRRLAREMHDGVAQDIASLGYLVDAIAGDATVERQQERIAILRDRITAIVAEIRRSLVNLRTDIGESESLGAAIAAIARNLSESSSVTINVTTDETTHRLRPEVEAELFRIAQEAMNNALKHAEATVVEVHCQVRSPAATITVADNGRGMGTPREDSHGVKIMRERAALVGGVLAFTATPSGGVTVTVSVADDSDGGAEEVTVIGAPFDSETRVGA